MMYESIHTMGKKCTTQHERTVTEQERKIWKGYYMLRLINDQEVTHRNVGETFCG